MIEVEEQRSPSRERVCVIVHAWPRLSMTFVAQELVGLEREGLELWIGTYGAPDKIRHPIHDQLRADVHRLPGGGPGLGRFLQAWRKVRHTPGYGDALQLFRREFRSGRKKRQWRAFARGVIIAAEMPRDIRAVYVHFIGSSATVARYAAMISGVPLAASAHARDIWTSSEADICAKLAAMRWCTTCTTVGADRLRELADDPDKVHLIYHGLSFDRFPNEPPKRSNADGSDPADPVRILSVGRAVEKKGFDVLLNALAALPADLHWRWTHVGDGKIIDDLRRRAEELGLSGQIEWLGARDQQAVIELYRTCDLFALPCREASDGDRDGLPNVLMEAQSQALACLSTSFSEIPELIVDGETGVLVPPGEAPPLTAALERLMRSPAQRERLGMAGYRRVRSRFESDSGIRQIAGLLRQII
jgi:glycosyltransferase involved in cell wall biosynthesis